MILDLVVDLLVALSIYLFVHIIGAEVIGWRINRADKNPPEQPRLFCSCKTCEVLRVKK